jgi:hypothetical protein
MQGGRRNKCSVLLHAAHSRGTHASNYVTALAMTAVDLHPKAAVKALSARGSVAAAAQQLGLSPSAVNRALVCRHQWQPLNSVLVCGRRQKVRRQKVLRPAIVGRAIPGLGKTLPATAPAPGTPPTAGAPTPTPPPNAPHGP